MTSRREEGIALVKILFMMTILLAVAAYASRATRVDIRISQNDYLGKRALQIAEAGLGRAWRQIETDLTAGQTLDQEITGGAGFWSTDGAGTGSRSGYRTASIGSGSYYVRVENNADDPGPSASTTDNDKLVLIRAIGDIGGSERVIKAVLEQLPLFGNGLFAKYGVDLRGGGTTDSYDSSLGSYGGSNANGNQGNVGSNGDITNNGTPTTVNGTENAGGTITQGSATITGGMNPGQPLVALPPVSPCTSFSNGAGITPANDYNSNNHTLRGNSSDQIVLQPGNYCFDSITLNGNATLTVNGAVTITVNSTTNLTGGGVVNSTGDPSNLKIYSSQVGTGNSQGITVNGGASAAMLIYAPETNITFTGGSSIFGAAVGGTIKLSGGTNFHYDTHSASLGGAATQLISWHEVRS